MRNLEYKTNRTPGKGPHLQFWRRLFLKLFNVEVIYTGAIDNALSGSLLITSNHQSLLDGLIIGLAVPRRICFGVVPKHCERHFFISPALKTVEALGLAERLSIGSLPDQRPVPNTVDARRFFKIREMERIIVSGQAVMLFPEGRICQPNNSNEMKRGAIWLKERTGCTELKCEIFGASDRKFFSPQGTKMWSKITLTI